MDKTMRNVIITGIVFILIAAGLSAVVMLSGCSVLSAGSLDEARAEAINTLADKSGFKTELETTLRTQGRELAQEYGMPAELADQVVDSLAIQDWKAVVLPSDAVETETFTIPVEGTPVEITTYEDVSIVTIGAYGQNVTLSVPESAQYYIPYATYLQYLQETQ